MLKWNGEKNYLCYFITLAYLVEGQETKSVLPLKLRDEDVVILENYCQSSGKGLRVSLSLKISFFVAEGGAEKGREPFL